MCDEICEEMVNTQVESAKSPMTITPSPTQAPIVTPNATQKGPETPETPGEDQGHDWQRPWKGDWTISDRAVAYPAAITAMEQRVAAMGRGEAPEQVWLLEHPPLYTAGTSANSTDLLTPDRFPVFPTGRGGEYTYHGPGQRIAYVMLDLNKRQKDVRRLVLALEEWIILTLAEFSVIGERRTGRVGVWVARPDKPRRPDGSMAEDKIAALGVRVRKWISFHGLSINVDPELEHFSGIVPCGLTGYGVTSLHDLGITATMDDLDVALKQTFSRVF